MNPLTSHGISSVYHCAPLHYLLFIARSGALLSKTALLRGGYTPTHFRSSSHNQDKSRGFADYVHLTVDEFTPIASAKLKRGFPHFTVKIPSEDLNAVSFDLCRYNIAKTRYLRRGEKPGPEPSEANGFYYGDIQVPIARSTTHQVALLNANYLRHMIEVLVPDCLRLSQQAILLFHSNTELRLASELLVPFEISWGIALAPAASHYVENPNHTRTVLAFLQRASLDPDWKGNGLEFDRV